MLRAVRLADADCIARIYNHYVLHTIVTFEETPVSRETMAARITETTASLPWLVCEAEGRLLGYAYASPWKTRCAYRYAAKATVYLDGVAGSGPSC